MTAGHAQVGPSADRSAPEWEAVRRARAGLLRVTEPPAPAIGELVEQFGPVAVWQQVLAGTVTGPAGREVAARVQSSAVPDLQAAVSADLAAAEAAGARLLVPEDAEWPGAAFHGFRLAAGLGVTGAAAPLALWVRGGGLAHLPDNGVAVVGSRACSPYGQRVAADVGYLLAEGGRTVVSGAAFGVDAAAHRAALAAESAVPTVAVLACGIDRAYPAANAPLLAAIAARGAVVSEYPPGTHPARHRFLVRNRLIAALGRGTVVVEAGRRSGTLSTAAAARHLNRVVMAVPGPVTSALSVGCHALLAADQALLVTGAQDIADRLWPADAADPAAAVLVVRSPDGERVFDALPARASRTVTELARASGVAARDVLAALALLDAEGVVTGSGGGWRRKR